MAVAAASFVVPMYYPAMVKIDETQVTDIKQFIESQNVPNEIR